MYAPVKHMANHESNFEGKKEGKPNKLKKKKLKERTRLTKLLITYLFSLPISVSVPLMILYYGKHKISCLNKIKKQKNLKGAKYKRVNHTLIVSFFTTNLKMCFI